MFLVLTWDHASGVDSWKIGAWARAMNAVHGWMVNRWVMTCIYCGTGQTPRINGWSGFHSGKGNGGRDEPIQIVALQQRLVDSEKAAYDVAGTIDALKQQLAAREAELK